MKKASLVYSLLLFAVLSIFKTIAFAQESPSINHISVYVVDMQKSSEFYKKVMLFKEIPEPFHDGKHVWLRIGAHSQLHIIPGAKAVKDGDINIHLAFAVPSLQKFIDHLEQIHVNYRNWPGDGKTPTSRPDGVKQVYLQDPDNNWIEVNDDKF